MKNGRVDVLGVGISPINLDAAMDQIHDWIIGGTRAYVCVCTVHTIMECQRSAELRKTVNAAGMVTPDGMPLVWLSRLAGHANVSRVYGPDLMLAELQRTASVPHRHFLYGGGPGVAETLRQVMRRRFPGVEIVGTFTPPFATVEGLCTEEAASQINAASADIVWVGISSPKQEHWMARMRPRLQAPVLIGVGAAFDFHAGRVRQAPRWIQQSGFEWLFRLSQEPQRLWRRYLVDNPAFLFKIARQALGRRG
jgi:N-acetylglucosaminyldiphosphoundecaprenol N-acetyl-beta-D-mannosaminyltransferase